MSNLITGGFQEAEPREDKVVKELTTTKNINLKTDIVTKGINPLTILDALADTYDIGYLKKRNRIKKELLVSRERKGRGEMVEAFKAQILREARVGEGAPDALRSVIGR